MTKVDTSKNKSKTQADSLGFLFWLKWLASFIWPVKVVTHQSQEAYLELVLFQGKRLLNSRNANYSNGNLQTAYRRLFEEVDLDLSTRHRVLILGFGFGGVAQLITDANPNADILGVESNTTILTWYKAYCRQKDNVKVIIQDAKEFVSLNDDTYDLIVCDIYEDLDVPAYFESTSFIQGLSNRLATSGVLVFNKVVQNTDHKSQLITSCLNCLVYLEAYW